MPTSTPINKAPLKILMLHGYTQNGTLFHAKTRAVQKALIRAFPSHEISFSFPTGPHRLLPPAPNLSASSSSSSSFAYSSAPPDISSTTTNGNANGNDTNDKDGNFGWWIRPNDDSVAHFTGLDTTLHYVAGIMRAEGPFDGIIGFSQGAALAGLLASALEPERVFPEEEMGFPSPFEDSSSPSSDGKQQQQQRWHPPLKFAVIYSGLRVMDVRCRAFYNRDHDNGKGGIATTPMLHVMGQVDSVLDERRSRALVDCCGEPGRNVVVHPGGHFVPSQRPWVDAVVGFVGGVLDGVVEVVGRRRGLGGGLVGGEEVRRGMGGIKEKKEEEEKVEDMQVPF